MKRVTLGTAAILAALACAGTGSLLLPSLADAQSTQTAPAGQPSAGQPQRPDRPMPPRPGRQFDPTRHIDGRIAYMKAELKITDAQSAQWDKVAQAYRQNAVAMRDAVRAMRPAGGPRRGQPNAQANAQTPAPPSAADRLEQRAKFAELRANGDRQFVSAFKPLYDSLSADQKHTADELFGQHHHDHGPRRG